MGVHTGPDVRFAISTVTDTGVTFPMVIDYDSSILGRYTRTGEGVILFPLAYLFDRGLKVNSMYIETEPTTASLKADIEALLAQ
jgi:acetoacetate decarboxylase